MKALLELVFLVAILIFCQFSQHVVKDCAVSADFVLLFRCLLILSLNQARDMHTSALVFYYDIYTI